MKLFILTLLALLHLSIVSAATCTDSDGGPIDPADPATYLAIPGDTSTKSTTLSDYCTHEKQGKRSSEGPWIKEYMCIGILALGKDYQCKDYGYDTCIAEGNRSACVKSGQKTLAVQSPESSSAVAETGIPAKPPKKPRPPQKPHCGDKKVNLEGEECDPPGRICIVEGMPGLCQSNCKCQLYKKSEGTTIETTIETTSSSQSEHTDQAEPDKTAHSSSSTLKESFGLFTRLWKWLNVLFS